MEDEPIWFQDEEYQEIIDKVDNEESLTLSEIKFGIRILHKLPVNISCNILQQYLLGLIDRLEDE